MPEGKTTIALPDWAGSLALSLFRAGVIVSCGVAWSLWRDVDQMKHWKEDVHPLEAEATAAQLQAQITTQMQRTAEDRTRLQMLESDILMLQLQVARMEH